MDLAALERLFSRSDPAIRGDGPCPSCRVDTGKRNPMKAVAMLDAEEKGWLTIGDRGFVESEDTQLVFCPVCKWYGYPSRKELSKGGL